MLSAGLIEEGSELQCGPLDDGSLIDVVVTSLQRFKVNRRHVRPGESSTLAIACQDSDKSAYLEKSIRKGMVLLSKSENNLSSICTFFKASIFLMPNSKEVSIGFQGMLFTNVRQSVTVVAIHKKKSISPNESATVMLHFNKHPEYIHPGYRLLIQQGVTKAVGRVMDVYPQMSWASKFISSLICWAFRAIRISYFVVFYFVSFPFVCLPDSVTLVTRKPSPLSK